MIAVSALMLIAALVILWRTEAAKARHYREWERYWFDHWSLLTERLRKLQDDSR